VLLAHHEVVNEQLEQLLLLSLSYTHTRIHFPWCCQRDLHTPWFVAQSLRRVSTTAR
jgi:hypothetical protein